MLSSLKLALKVFATENPIGKFCCQCCCCFPTEPLVPKDTTDGGATEEGGGETKPADVEKGETQPAADPKPTTSQKGSPVAASQPTDQEQPGPSTSATEPEGGGVQATPLMSHPPPASSVHKKESPIAENVTETSNEAIGFIEVEEPLCLAGKVLISFTYMPNANKINLNIIRTQDIPKPDRGGADNICIHLCVLPMRKQRFRTKTQPVSNGVFNQMFSFEHMTRDQLEVCAIRIRVYGVYGRLSSNRLIGEVKVSLSKIDLTSPLSDGDIWKNLSPKGTVVRICFFFIIGHAFVSNTIYLTEWVLISL